MASRKRATAASTSCASKKQKRQVTMVTFKKWQTQLEREHQTLSWLRCDPDATSKELVGLLWCDACRKHERSITGMKNFSRAWIEGSTNHKTSNIVDHANSDQHRAAKVRTRAEAAKATNQPITSYSPIARSLMRMDNQVMERMKKKFDICYIMAKEGIAFRKYPALHELEVRHGVDLGFAYRTKDSAKTFTHFIADSQRQDLFHKLSSTPFYSFLMDGSTDTGNVEDELIALLYSIKDDVAQEVRSCARYFAVQEPTKADANGLLRCLGEALKPLGIDNILDKANVLGVATEGKPILIGGGTDGASVNIGEQNGMRGRLQEELPWLMWTWCYAHRLELACKDSLCSKLFKEIDEMLLRLYYLYAKSPKKCRELAGIVADLKEVFEFPKGGDKPIRSQGSRWITHKRNALQRLIDRYGAYLSHLITLSEDASIRSYDRARIKGYLQQWKQAKMLVGAALYVDVLKPPSLLSLSLQGEKLDIVGGIHHLLKSSKSLRKLAEQDPHQWPTLKLVSSRVKEENGSKVYQGAVLSAHTPATIKQCTEQAVADLERLDERMRERLEWSDVKMLRAILLVLDTRSWASPSRGALDDSDDEIDDDTAEVKEAVEYITTSFREPLEAAGVTLATIQDEAEEVVHYARKYLSIGTEGYQKIWYKLYSAPDVEKWPNMLRLCELLFSLPFSNGQIERMFSVLKVTKTDRRTNLQTETLSDLLEISMEGPNLSDFSADRAVELWWDDCKTTRRVNQAPRKEYQPRKSTASTATSSEPQAENLDESMSGPEATESEVFALHDWDEWFAPPSPASNVNSDSD